MAGSSHAGTRCRKTGAAARSRAASSGSVSSAAYASSTKRHVVSMPFQSTSSLKAARPLTSMAATNTPNQAQPAPQSQSTGLLVGLRGELQDGLALADVAEVLAGELLDVGGVVAQPLDRPRQLVGARAQRDEVALHRVHLAAHLRHLQHRAHAVGAEADGDEQDGGDAERPRAAAHRAVREERLRPGHEAPWPSSSSMRSSWLYLAVRSLRATE